MITSPQAEKPGIKQLFPGDSELAGLMRALDWSSSRFGRVERGYSSRQRGAHEQ
ncbi:MAG: hypothetical protein ICV76_01845 [Nitrospiraceae bacterium]|nr:hypothetical protein [Nitrospiraceae bacterium]